MRIIIGMLIFAILLFLSLLVVLMFNYIKQYTYIVLMHIRKLRNMYYIVYKIIQHIYVYKSITIPDIIFMLFIKFYDDNKYNMPQWELDAHYFPNGIKDISNMYYWITQIRHKNYEILKNISMCNTNNIVYYGSVYNAIRFTIKNGILHIIPITVTVAENFQLTKMLLKMNNELYKLDTEKAYWILERRKFFGF